MYEALTVMKNYFTIIFIHACLITLGQDQWKNVYTESAWVERDKWQKADELIRQLNIKAGSKVADVGSHEGYMTLKLAASVGSAERCYRRCGAIQLNKLKEHLEKRKSRTWSLSKVI
jgi:hypothetical protein